MSRPLRFWLSLGLSALVALAVLSVILVVLGGLVPRLNAEVKAQNRMLSTAAAAQIDRFLADFSSVLEHLAEDIADRPALSEAELESMLDTVAQAEKGIRSVYIVDARDRVIGVGLPMAGRPLRDNQLGVDFSGRSFVGTARRTQTRVWSDTYLSARGNIVVALARPLAIRGMIGGEPVTHGVLVGELNLEEVSRFAGLLSRSDNVLTIIVDRRGNVVGHPDPERALRQENLKHLAPLHGLVDSPVTASFRLDSADYLGSTTPIPETGWTALVGQPTEKAFAIVRSTLTSLVVASAVALLMAVIAALIASRRMMRRMRQFSRHVEAVAAGNYEAKIPPSGVAEIENLSQHMHRMAGAVLEREARLRESEANFRMLVESAPMGIALISDCGRFVLINAAFSRMFGYDLCDVPDVAAWLQRTIPDRECREEAMHCWQAQTEGPAGATEGRRLFRLRRADGQYREIELVAERLPDQRLLVTFADVTERRLDEARLQRAAKVFSHAREGIIITDAAGTIVEVNDTFTRITGYTHDESVGQTPRILKSGIQGPEFYDAMWQSLAQKGFWYGELWNRGKHGELYAALTNITAVCDADGKTQNYVALFTDITQIKAYQRQLEHVAHYDALTSLPNRVLLADRLQRAMIQSQRRGLSLAVLYLDLDGFKPVNDHFDHGVGDRLLVAIAQSMKEALRDGDTISRIGGDEFVAVLVDLEQEYDCFPVLQRLLEAASNPFFIDGNRLQVSASIGVTFFPRDGADADQLMRHADQAMYQAKQSGKNRYHVFDVARDAAAINQVRSLEDVRGALERNEFVLHYQPKVNMRSGAVVGAEALIRWQHPERGLLPPSAFLHFVEDHAISVELGEWVIDTALAQIEAWQAGGLDIPVSVNIGARQLLHSCFVESLDALLAAHPSVPPDRLELEILETSALEDMAQVSELMYTCLESGVSFSLDDFGTGYSSLTYLKQLPADVLKIDQSFVRGMLDDPNDLAIVNGVIGLASAFRRRVIAEGVETIEHGAKLLALGCELAQGYGIARPMPAADFPAWVAHWRPDAAWSSSGAGETLPIGAEQPALP
ncbi:MAG: EAL domain-containing protein [Propionivibrio sp.]